MKNKPNTFLSNLLIIAVSFAAIMLIYVFVLAEVKGLNKEKIRLEERLVVNKNKLETRMVEVQRLTTEERIANIASDSLGLIRALKPFETIRINPVQLKKIEEIVNGKYE